MLDVKQLIAEFNLIQESQDSESEEDSTTVKNKVNTFLTVCRKKGWTYSTNDDQVSITKTFEVDDDEAYDECNSEYGDIISLISVDKSKSKIAGTSKGNVGGKLAKASGRFYMKVSGVTKPFLDALNTIQ